MKMLKNYTQEQVLKAFYTSGIIIFIIVGIANSYTNFYYWENMILSARVSSVFMNIFNYVLAIFFFSLLKSLKTSTPETLKDEDLDKLFEEAKE